MKAYLLFSFVAIFSVGDGKEVLLNSVLPLPQCLTNFEPTGYVNIIDSFVLKVVNDSTTKNIDLSYFIKKTDDIICYTATIATTVKNCAKQTGTRTVDKRLVTINFGKPSKDILCMITIYVDTGILDPNPAPPVPYKNLDACAGDTNITGLVNSTHPISVTTDDKAKTIDLSYYTDEEDSIVCFKSIKVICSGNLKFQATKREDNKFVALTTSSKITDPCTYNVKIFVNTTHSLTSPTTKTDPVSTDSSVTSLKPTSKAPACVQNLLGVCGFQPSLTASCIMLVVSFFCYFV